MTKKKDKKRPKVSSELEGFDIKIDSFGKIVSTMDVDEINKFLDKNVEDKKLTNRDDKESKKK